MIVVELLGDPVAKGRPRFSVGRTRGGRQFVNIYTPAKTRAYERAMAWAGKVAMAGQKPLLGPLKVTVTAFFAVPASWPAKKRDAALAGVIRPTGKPDVENCCKSATDGLNGIVYRDDAQIVDQRGIKLYAELPRIKVEIEELSPQFFEALETAAEDA